MTPQDLIAAFETLADAPDGTKRLRELVLQLAVRGKLVPQDAEETPATLDNGMARAALRTLRECGKVARHSLGTPPSLDELEFDLPEGWAIARLSQIAAKKSGNSKLIKGRLHAEPAAARFPGFSAAGQDVWLDTWEYEGEAVIVSAVGARCGKCFRADGRWSAIANTAVVWPFSHAVRSDYLLMLLNDETFWVRSGGAQPFIKFGDSVKRTIAVPPLAEQHRIVAKVDALMGLLDRLEAARDARDTTRASLRDAALAALSDAEDTESVELAWTRIAEHMDDLFTDPADVAPLRQTILQLAVRGRLVPQDASDEPAAVLLERIAVEKARLVKEKKIRKPKVLPPIEADEVPFAVPQGWEWCRFGLTHLFTNGFAFKSSEYQEDGVGIVRMSNLQDGEVVCRNMKYVPQKYMNELSHDLRVRPGDLLIGMSGSIGQPAFNRTSTTFLLNQRVGKVVPLFADKFFIAIFLKTIEQHYLAISFGSGIKNLSTKQIAESLCPLPPLAEQHRIVAKVDALMGLCDDLEARLTAARTTRGAFAAAAIHHLDTE